MKSDDALSELMRELQKSGDYIENLTEWFRKSIPGPRWKFRVVGVAIILASVSVPFVSLLRFDQKDLVVSAIALLIAALTGLNTFFRWDNAWRSLLRTKVTLEQLLAKWDIEIIEARSQSDPNQARDMAIAATRRLILESNAVYGENTESFVEAIQSPTKG